MEQHAAAAYDQYQDVLVVLSKRKLSVVNQKLGEINGYLQTYRHDKKPTAVDFAIQFKHLQTKEEIDQYIQLINERIIYTISPLDLE